MTTNGFPKSEKLCGQESIKRFYASARRFTCYPLRVAYLKVDAGASSPKVLVRAPKNLFKHATDRNRLKRLMREAYRLNSEPLKQHCRQTDCGLQLSLVYVAAQVLDYTAIEAAMQKTILKLTTAL